MKEYLFKAFYFNVKGKLIGTDIIQLYDKFPNLEFAKQFASYLADEHYPDCVEYDVCLLADKKELQCWQH